MIGYTTLGTDDLVRSGQYYDALLVRMGGERAMQAEDFIAWSFGDGKSMFSVHLPADGGRPSAGNGVMVGLRVDTPEQVRALHHLALSLGGRDEGSPGPRNDQGFYAAYFRDPHGNKLNLHCFSSEANESSTS